jgi:hypothetical protein
MCNDLAAVSVLPAHSKSTTLVKMQVAVSAPKLAADKQTAGWLIEQENCRTSYSIPTGLAIYQASRKRLLGDGLMIYDWSFVGEGSQIAVSTGTVHE